ncbi:hypothetical protein ACKWTF_015216 [Chironomus riparius]
MLNICVALLIVLSSISYCNTAIYNKYADMINENYTKVGRDCVQSYELNFYKNATKFNLFSAWSSFNFSYKYGNSHDFGNILVCKNVDVKELSTQYCLVQYFSSDMIFPVPPKLSAYQNIWTNLDASFLGAVCVPSSCSVGDVKNVLESMFVDRNLTFGDKIDCKKEFNKKSEDVIENLAISMLNWLNLKRVVLFAGILLVSIILSFLKIENLSVLFIVKDLFNCNTKTSSTAYLNGLKAITTILIILYHCLITRIIFPFKGGENLQELLTGAFYLPIQTVGSLMEIFFIIGGILTAKTLSKEFDKDNNKFLLILMFYIKRLSRLVPVTALIIVLTLTSNSENLVPYSFGIEKENCKKFWWMALSFNFMDVTKIYAGYIWFVSVYLQLTLMAPFVFWSTKQEKFGYGIKYFVLLASTVIRFNHTFDGYYDMLFSDQGFDSFHDEIFSKYISTQYRLLPFFGGLLLERFLSNESKTKNIVSFFLIFWMFLKSQI